jgi:hypothetical protein
MRKLLIILSLALQIGTCKSQRALTDALTPKTLRNSFLADTSKIPSETLLFCTRLNFDNLTFSQLIETDSVEVYKKSRTIFEVGLDRNKKICRITYYEDGSVFYMLQKNRVSEKFSIPIFTLFKRDIFENRLVPSGVVINVDSLSYFVHYAYYNNENAVIGLDFIMCLDDRFQVLSYCKLTRGFLNYIGRVNYDQQGRVKNVTLFAPITCFKMKEETSFSQYHQYNIRKVKLYNIGDEIATVDVKVKETYLKYPFWFWEGEHGYR